MKTFFKKVKSTTQTKLFSSKVSGKLPSQEAGRGAMRKETGTEGTNCTQVARQNTQTSPTAIKCK